MKKLNIAVISIIIFVVTGGVLFANPDLISPQRTATSGQFWSEADLFIDMRGYAALDFNKFFGLVSFEDVSKIKIGFASNFGQLYFACYYSGNTFNMPAHRYSEQMDGQGFFASPKTMRVYTVLPEFTGTNFPENNISLLFGFADMGIRLSLFSDYWTRAINEDFRANTNFYKSFVDERGSIMPELAWGMTKDIIEGRGIKPHVYINLDLKKDYQRYEIYGMTANDITDTIAKSNNVVTLDFTAALGGFSFINNDGFDFGFDLWYNLQLPIYDNEYMWSDGTALNTGKGFKGLYSAADTTANIFTEQSEMRHAVTPYLYASWSGERVKLAAEIELGMGFGNEDKTKMSLNANSGDFVKNGVESLMTYFMFSPVISLGMQWAVVPEKFFLNVGGHLGLGTIRFTAADNFSFNNGTEDKDASYKSYDDTFTTARTGLKFGARLNITENVSLQANCGIDTGNIANVFHTGSHTDGSMRGLLAFSEILATLKF